MNLHADQLSVGWLNSPVGKVLNGITEIMGSNSVQAWIFFQALISQLLKLCV